MSQPDDSTVAEAAAIPEIYDPLEELLAAETDAEASAAECSRMHARIQEQRDAFAEKLKQLERACAASDLLRDVIAFLRLAQQLDSIGADATPAAVADAAVMLGQLDILLKESRMDGVVVVEKERQRATRVDAAVREIASTLLAEGLSSQNQAQIGDALLIYWNLGTLSSCIEELVQTRLAGLYNKLKQILGLSSAFQDSGSGSGSAAGYRTFGLDEFWTQISDWMDAIERANGEVSGLQAALLRKRDPVSGQTLQQLMSKVGLEHEHDASLVEMFWQKLSLEIKRELEMAAAESAGTRRIFDALCTGYPRVLRMLNTLFSGIAEQGGVEFNPELPGHEAKLLLDSMAAVEDAYVRRCRVSASITGWRLIKRSMWLSGAGAARSELDIIKFDSRLAKRIIQAGAAVVLQCKDKAMQLLRAPDAFEIGQGLCTPAQQGNIAVANAVYALSVELDALRRDFVDTVPELQEIELVEIVLLVSRPMLWAFRVTLEDVLSKMHDQLAGTGTGRTARFNDHANCSAYLDEFGRKLTHLQREYLARFQCGSLAKEWMRSLLEQLIMAFLRQASLVHPLDEAKRLRLAADATQLEFYVSHVASANSQKLPELGKTYHALRAFRPLLFADVEELQSRSDVLAVPPLLRLHQLLAHAHGQIGMPHELLGISLDAYIERISETPAETLLQEILSKAKQAVQARDPDGSDTALAQLMMGADRICHPSPPSSSQQ
ncbi:hypothetical protein THASP1DRAFT_27804 [Thamnocephalis sphaerospora]|uniref:Conserved oligomeric Golgi complex subunit 5 helical domain-containing protein n=1 Tax=Thamnocephalis sphaerospora TaxID=78915 RepID=A0A4P9XWP1_9FUNG|nr:hypothetical protein THASP1DRAFT_27804 [Thamnocephalis sphaerospora]|eukprot:RKP10432.1 hypothetical protein THASP1DRAFT_27804 [Thamnocephalis sphaerospora]